jgi:hypothetical protein
VDAFDFRTNMDSLYRVRIEARLLDEEEVDSDDSDDEEETNGDVMDEDGKEDGKADTKKKSKRTNAFPFHHFSRSLVGPKVDVAANLYANLSSPLFTNLNAIFPSLCCIVK